MEKEKEFGIIYLLVNDAMPGLVKIGMTLQDDVQIRMAQLATTGVPVAFECVYACRVKAGSCLKLEKALHRAFAPDRVNVKREFFRTDVERIIPLLDAIKEEDVTDEFNQEMTNELTQEEKNAQERMRKIRRPNLNFQKMGIKPGQILFFEDNPEIQVVVVNDRQVSYNGENYYLTAITKKLLDVERELQPTSYWLCNGRNLKDIYEETYAGFNTNISE